MKPTITYVPWVGPHGSLFSPHVRAFLFQNVHLVENGSFLSVGETLLITPILTFEHT